MFQRQEILRNILTLNYGFGKDYPDSISDHDLLKNGLLNEVIRTYKRLGGILVEPPFSFGKWDICLSDIIVEFDEEQHFNRYRSITLNSFIYHMEKGFDIMDYAKYCTAYENICLIKASWGKYWTSPSTERQFGLPGINKDLEGNGSPRWRQRAFYDYLRDVFAIIYQVRLIRISVYDKLILNGRIVTIGDLLDEKGPHNNSEILKFMDQKLKAIK